VWARAGSRSSEIKKLASAWEMTPDEVSGMIGEDDTLIEPENWQTWETWKLVSTQWVYGGMGGIVGLNYAGVKVVLDMTVKKKARAEVFQDLQLMERVALPILNDKGD